MNSFTELLAWVNELLSISYTKVEQCGTGAAYCQIMDSVYGMLLMKECILLFSKNAFCLSAFVCLGAETGDVPMTRVKMNAKHEYEFVANYKVLQNTFKAKKVDKARLFLYLASPLYCPGSFSPSYPLFHLKTGLLMPFFVYSLSRLRD